MTFTDRITILEAHKSITLTKRFKADGTVDGAATGKWFKAHSVEFTGLDGLLDLVRRVEKAPNCIAVRGQRTTDADAERTILEREDDYRPERGMTLRRESIFMDVPRWVMCLDVDGFTPTLHDPVAETADAAREFIAEHLPPEFAGVSFVHQLSSSAGTARAAGRLKVHLFFALTEPLTSAQLLQWVKRFPAVDLVTLRTIQPIYLAAPVMEDGVEDPVKGPRSGIWRGDRDQVDLVLTDAERAAQPAEVRAGGEEQAILENDPIGKILIARGLIREYVGPRAGWSVECPRQDKHSEGATSPRGCSFFPGLTGGRALASFRCLHMNCEGATRGDFLSALGPEAIEAGNSAKSAVANAGLLPAPRQTQTGADDFTAVDVEVLPAVHSAPRARDQWRTQVESAGDEDSLRSTLAALVTDPGLGRADSKALITIGAARLREMTGLSIDARALESDLRKVASVAPVVVDVEPVEGGLSHGEPRGLSLAIRDMIGSRLLRYQDAWYEWQETTSHYEVVSVEAVEKRVSDWLADRGMAWNKITQLSAIMRYLAGELLVSPRSLPAWRGDAPAGMENIDDLVHCANGVLNWRTGAWVDASPALIALAPGGVAWDVLAEWPAEWVKFLDSILPGDKEAQTLVMRWIGYLMVSSIEQHKALLVVGPTRAGKGIIEKVIDAIVGCGSPTSITDLSGPFGLERLEGRRTIRVSDARMRRSDSTAVAVERILNIVAGDEVSINRKGRPETSAVLRAKLMIFSNEVPALVDTGGALGGRFVTLTLTHSFFGREDFGLLDRLLAELPGIAQMALTAYREFALAGGRFTDPESSRALREELQEAVNPIAGFVRECFDEGGEGDHQIALPELYAAYLRWCQDEGLRYPLPRKAFTRALRVADRRFGPPVKISLGGRKVRGLVGPKPSAELGLVDARPLTGEIDPFDG